MPHLHRDRFLWIGGLLALAASAAIGFGFPDYESGLRSIAQMYQFDTKAQMIFREKMLTPERFRLLRAGLCMLPWVLGLGLYALWRKRAFFSQIRAEGLGGWASFRKSLHVLGTFQKTTFWTTLGLLCLGRLVLLVQYPQLHLDEANSFVYLVHRGLGASLAYYPSPNNHLAYTFLAYLAYQGGFSPFWAMKMPALLSGLLLSALLWSYVWLRCRDFWVAWAAMCFIGLLSATHTYGLIGRGYILQCLAVLLAIAALQYWHKGTLPKGLWVGAHVLGFWAVPSYLYAFVVLQGLWWYRFRILDKAWLYSHLWIALCVSVLYAPVLLAQGGAVLWNNAWVRPMSEGAWWQHLPDFLYETAAFFWGDALLGLGLSVGFLLLLLVLKPFRILVGLLLVLLVLLYVQKLLPPARVFTWVSVALALGYATGLHRFQTYQKVLLGLLPLLLALQLYNYPQYYALQGEYRSVTEVLQKLPAKPCRIATASDVYLTFIRLEAIEKNHAWQTYSDVTTQSDFLLLAPHSPAPAAYFLCYQDDFVALWQKVDF
jgi:hypothetical protein